MQPRLVEQPKPESIQSMAAVDLGSNSFHLVVARLAHGQLDVVDRLREPVRLAAGIDDKGRLTAKAQAAALACLERFGQRLRNVPAGSVRAVGTNTLRKARNAGAFLSEAREILGHPLEVISGREEARLIYLGVAHDQYQASGRRLVIDIGGGSTECILGEGFEALETESLYMGCVSFTERFFPGGRLRGDAMERAMVAARLELQPLERHYRTRGWDAAVGSSGTVLAVEQILMANGWSKQGVSRKGLAKLRRALRSAGRLRSLELDGLQESRAPVLPGGVAILSAAFDAFGLEHAATSGGALREGLLHDLVGRIGHEDVRDRTIRRFVQRYEVDVEQAARVERTALSLLDQCAERGGFGGELGRKLLAWAAQLHEIGLSVGHAGHHRHGAYLVTHSDMPGFSRSDQELLAALIQCHRRRVRKTYLPTSRSSLSSKAVTRLCALLRLAVRLNRSRGPELPPDVRASVGDDSSIDIVFPAGWLDSHPLTRADLEDEADMLKGLGFTLDFA